jgi:Ca2+-binding RTX toxin-like protein
VTAYNQAGTDTWTAVDHLDGTVTFTSIAPGLRAPDPIVVADTPSPPMIVGEAPTSPGTNDIPLVPGTPAAFLATFGTTDGTANTATFDGVGPVTLTAGQTAAENATEFVTAYNQAGTDTWTAVDHLDGTVTFTSIAPGLRAPDPIVVADTPSPPMIVGEVPTAPGTAADPGTAGHLVLSNLASGGTVELTATGDITANVTGALAGTADVLNLTLTGASLAAGTVTAPGVETVNIATGTTTASIHSTVDSLTLVDPSATSIAVTGNNGLTLTTTGDTAVTSFDASGVVGNGAGDTAANLAVTYTSANTNATTITGGAGNDTLIGNNGSDVIRGGAGNDTIFGEIGQDTLTGGAGADVFGENHGSGFSDSAVATPDTITDWNAGGTADTLRFISAGLADAVAGQAAGPAVAGTSVAISAGGLATFDPADNTLAKELTTLGRASFFSLLPSR